VQAIEEIMMVTQLESKLSIQSGM